LGNIKIIILVLIFGFYALIGFSQTVEKVTLPECYDWAKESFPMMQQQAVAEKLSNLRLQQIDLQSRPTISWNAQVTG
jgi:hypothetical protein